MRALCDSLSTSQFPEAATLDLNLFASEVGEFPDGFGDLRFSHPARRGRTLEEWVEVLANDRIALERLAFDANRAFAGCESDRGVLFASATQPLCQPDGVTRELVGPLGYVCEALDDECSRGSERVLDGARCCEVVPRADGIECNEGSGACMAGACVPRGYSPEGGPFEPDAQAPDAGASDGVEPPAGGVENPPQLRTLGYRGDEHWIDVVGDYSVGLSLADGGFRVLVGGDAWVDLPEADSSSDPNGKPSLGDVRVSRHLELGAIGVLAPRAIRAILLPTSDEYCVVRGDPGDARIALSDCSTRGERLRCEADLPGIECTVVDGLARFEAPDLLMAWPIPDSAQPILDVFGALHLCIPIPGIGCIDIGRPVCHFGDTRSCQPRCGDSGGGISFCNVLGAWGRCISITRPTAERCNGRDDDCDGVTDESASPTCTDGLSCNIDVCSDGVCEHQVSAACDDSLSTACADFSCGGAIVIPERGRLLTTPLGCDLILRDLECADGCDCNGKELCNPTALGPLGNGCFPVPTNPCENSDPVDFCTQATCCGRGFNACLSSPYLGGSPPVDLGLIAAAHERLCGLARRFRRTFDVPFDPTDPMGQQIECLEERSLLGIDLFGRVDCDPQDEGEPDPRYRCRDYGECVPSTGQCTTVTARGTPAGMVGTNVRCDFDRTGASVFGDNACGQGYCNGDQTGCTGSDCPFADCELRPFSSGSAECEEREILGADRPRVRRGERFFRAEYDTPSPGSASSTDGTMIRYRAEYRTCGRFGVRCDTQEALFDICHVPQCAASDFQCDYYANASLCPPQPPGSCLVNTCSTATNVYSGTFSLADPSAVIGCSTAPNPALCTLPPNNQCYTSLCNPDGSCDLATNDGLCTDVPPGTECLVPTCLENGQCGTRPDDSRCPPVLICGGGELPVPRCRPDGRCEEPCNE